MMAAPSVENESTEQQEVDRVASRLDQLNVKQQDCQIVEGTDLWAAILRNDSECKSEYLPRDQEERPVEKESEDEEDRIKDYLIEEYTKEIDTYQRLLRQKEAEHAAREAQLAAEVEELTTHLDTLNAENEVLARKLCDLQSVMMREYREDAVETRNAKIEDLSGGIDCDLEHRLVLSAWKALQQQILLGRIQ